MMSSNPNSPCRATRILLQIELPLLVLSAIASFIAYQITLDTSPADAFAYQPSVVIEELLYPAAITAFSVLLTERFGRT